MEQLLLDPEDEHWRYNVSFDPYGYARKGKKLLHHIIFGNPKQGFCVDHRNQNKLDNRKENLRFVTWSENMHNTGPKVNNKFGIAGISEHRGGFRARIRLGYKEISLYHGPDFFLACCARKSYEATHVN